MNTTPPPSNQMPSLLSEAYLRLGYNDGTLLNATSQPSSTALEEEWLEKGDWLALGDQVGAEKIFFVNNDPVIVFYDFENAPTNKEQLEVFRQIWCMARPHCLFMALPGELRVYSLNQTPARNEEEWQRIEPLAIAKSIPDVVNKLNRYRREQVEFGRLFADDRFGSADQRADQRLILDLKTVRKELLETGLPTRYVHALIGRSIFIRYLEDRGVLTPAYFEQVAGNDPKWRRVLSQELEDPDLTPDWEKRRYDRILRNKEFAYALFKKLADDFNGDMFPKDEEEERAVGTAHLNLLRNFLLSNTGPQRSLFFWAYNFKIIPIDLISSIYEEFYHEDNDDDKGTHYTPSILVEYVLSKVLTAQRLASNPKILDPACGSGIFLVEAFRRIIRYNVQNKRRLLTSDELRIILRDQITGMEINKEAAHVATFSLYLALLHYQEPPDILANKRLPHLIHTANTPKEEEYYDAIFNTNTFNLTALELLQLEERLTVRRFPGRADVIRLYSSATVLPLKSHSFDVIVGNPPWGFKKGTTAEIRDAQIQAQLWCKVFGWSIGHKELSQAFIARTLNLLKPGGECGFLVSTGIFFKHHKNSERFREKWLKEVTIRMLVNFAHVRHSFFSATAPFAFVHYEAKPIDEAHRVYYWSAKKTAYIDKVRAVILGNGDLHQIRQGDLIRKDYLWKVYWWGSHRDAIFIDALKMNKTIQKVADEQGWPPPGRGFENDFPSGDHRPSSWLKEFKELPISEFSRYGPIDLSMLREVPELVHRHGNRSIYSGCRLLVKRGITQAEGVNGRIEARIDDTSYCFTNAIHGIGIDDLSEWQSQVLIGILWSSLARYYFFMTASSWGTWHHEIHLEEIMDLPIVFPDDSELQEEIVNVVTKLQNWKQERYSFWNLDRITDEEIKIELNTLEKRLDDAIFRLYQLSEAEVDLIQDTCNTSLDFFYNGMGSKAIKAVSSYPKQKQGLINEIPVRGKERGLEAYIRTFLEIWNQELEPDGEFRWRVVRPARIPMIAIVFTTQETGMPLPEFNSSDEEDWKEILDHCSKVLLQPVGRRIYIDGIVRAVTDTDIFILKRDERRYWTRSMAREDAEATLLQAMQLQQEAAYEGNR